MNINTITGVDVNRKWLLYDNDLLLVDGLDNIYQAIQNRLSCVLGDMSYFYDHYGSRLSSFNGDFINSSLLQEIANEVVRSLDYEPRLSNVQCDVARVERNTVAINVKGIIDESEDFEGNFLLDSVTRELDLVGWDLTQLELHIGLWDCKHQDNILDLRKGEPILIQCRVLNSHGNPVPIGVVDFFIGNVHRSVEVENGRADLLFTFPEKWENGEYTVEAKYRGLGKFSPAQDKLTVTLDDTWNTITELVNEYNYARPWEEVMFPTRVNDIMEGKVTSGEVYYYLNWDQILGTRINAHNMYTTAPTKGKAIWSHAEVYDEWDNYVQCGCVNFYIENLEGMLKATQTILQHGYILSGTSHTFLASKVYDENYEKVCGGEVEYSYREMPQILDTITEINDVMQIAYNHKVYPDVTVTDEDNIQVLDGDIDFSVRECGRCYPISTTTNTDHSFLKNKKLFTHSTVVDEDNMPVKQSDVAYSLDTLPIAVTTHDIDLFRNGARYGAMIVDINDNIIDSGTLVTSNNITNYVTNNTDDDESDDNIQLKLIGVDK